MTLSDCENIIRPLLSERRYQHCVNVAREAKALAERCGADTQKAQKAGLLHDIMKEAPPDEQLKIMEASGIILTNVERGRRSCGTPWRARPTWNGSFISRTATF